MVHEWTVARIEHVQLAMPVGREADARAFYVGVLGIFEVAKPAALAGRGGCWFERGDLKLHLGVEVDFRPARKAHVALVVEGLEALVGELRADGHVVDEASVPGALRVFVADPFGNRIELMAGMA